MIESIGKDKNIAKPETNHEADHDWEKDFDVTFAPVTFMVSVRSIYWEEYVSFKSQDSTSGSVKSELNDSHELNSGK